MKQSTPFVSPQNKCRPRRQRLNSINSLKATFLLFLYFNNIYDFIPHCNHSRNYNRNNFFIVSAQQLYPPPSSYSKSRNGYDDNRNHNDAYTNSYSQFSEFPVIRKEESLLSPFTFRITPGPSHILQAIPLAITNVIKGLLGGTLSFFAAPYVGMKWGGTSGFLSGSVVGGLGALLVPLAGGVIAATQVVMGLVRTPSTIHSLAQTVWGRFQSFIHDDVTHHGEQCARNTDYVLDVEYAAIVTKLNSKTITNTQTTTSRTKVQVKDTTYYDLLSVHPNATPAEIKRGYHEAARASHPDKNTHLDYDTSQRQFRNVHVAYQTLMDESKRKRYNRRGPIVDSNQPDEYKLDDNVGIGDGDGEDILNTIDPFVFFAIMFGTEAVEPYIGELRIAHSMDDFLKTVQYVKDNGVMDEDEFERQKQRKKEDDQQRKRVVDIARFLSTRVESYVSADAGAKGDKNNAASTAFRKECEEEARNILKESPTFGNIFLTSIGSAMQMEAEEFLERNANWSSGWRFRRGVASVKKKWLWNKTAMGVYGTIYGAMKDVLDAFSSSIELVEGERQEGIDGYDDERDGCYDGGQRGRKKCQERNFSAIIDEESLRDKFSEVLPTMIQDLAWAFNVRDITYTVGDACSRLLADTGGVEILNSSDNHKDESKDTATSSEEGSCRIQIPIEDRIKRAEALLILASTFLLVGKENMEETSDGININATMRASGNSDGSDNQDEKVQFRKTDDILARATVAAEAASMKAHGQDMAERERKDAATS